MSALFVVLIVLNALVLSARADIDFSDGQTINFKVFVNENRAGQPISLSRFNSTSELDSLANLTCFGNATRCSSFMIVHGFQSSSDSKWIEAMKNELFAHDANIAVFVIDWSRASKFSGAKYSLSSYKKAIKNTVRVTDEVTDILELLLRRNMLKVGRERDDEPVNTLHMHCIGHSLGSHVCGQIGKRIKESHLVLARITGLDPAGPLFKSKDERKKLSKEDANYVDIIHTSRQLGLVKQMGHTDFFPNDANIQPGCELDNEANEGENRGRLISSRETSSAEPETSVDMFELARLVDEADEGGGPRPRRKREFFASKLWKMGKRKVKSIMKAISCSHGRAHQYFIQSINERGCRFESHECSDWTEFQRGLCDSNRTNRMGFHSVKDENRKYFLNVDSSFPFCDRGVKRSL